MPAFVSPLTDPADWTYTVVETTLPDGLRYGGYTVRALRAQRASAANVVMPCLGLIGRATAVDGSEVVEIQTDPFPIRRVVLGLGGGLPTFYLIFADAAGLSVTQGQMAPDGEVLRSAVEVTIAAVFQDRVTRDPARWASQILTAINAAGGTPGQWQPFADAVQTQTNTGNRAPVLLLDHAGQPVRGGSVDLVFGSGSSQTVQSVTLVPADLGDLQRTVVRLDPTHPGLWSGNASFSVRPSLSAGEEAQLSLLEDGAGRVNEVTVNPAQRHVLATKATSWFAAQTAIPAGETASPLARYTRGNRFTPLVNGPEFFDDLFRRLQEARTANGRCDLAGWSMVPQTEFTRRREGEPADLPLTLEQAAQRISAAGGSCRFLPARFIQLDPGAGTPAKAEILAFYLIGCTVLVLNSFGVSFVRTDAAGEVIIVGLMFANNVLVLVIVSSGGAFLEPNKDAPDVLDPITRVGCVLSPYPARVEDNTAVAQPVTGFPFDTIFSIIRHFGIYHQKFAVVRTASGHVGYCGGIDLHPNRLDDADHLLKSPYHDLHAKVEGPAVRDLSISFNQRWARDGAGDADPFDPPDTAVLGTPGSDIVQVARTYFRPQDPSRALEFAPQGDRTIADTLLAAIGQASEYVYIEDQYLTPPAVYNNALIAKVANREIRKLIIVVPGLTDQPFGETPRSGLVAALEAADAGAGIVKVGYPRRRYTVPDNDLRSSSGRCLLAEALPAAPGVNDTVALTPEARVPGVPFWLAVEGELMWVYDESTTAAPPGAKRLQVVRGPGTRLVKGGLAPEGSTPAAHPVGSAATVVDLSGIYVHSKMMIVDDVFLAVGSANLNRRGLFHDGEINLFTMPEGLRAAPANPILQLRRRLWAEMLDLPADMAAPLLDDPLAASRLFDRSPLLGNRFVGLETVPDHLLFEATTGDGLVAVLLRGFVFGVGAINHVKLFDAVVDPSSAV